MGAELQDKYARYGWNLAVSEVVASGLHGTDLLQRPVLPAESRKVATTLAACGLTRLQNRRFLTLSYGQKRLVLLARALIRRPDLLLLDEFYNGLDADYRRRVDAILERARRRGQGWIAASHRSGDIPRGTRGVYEVRAGRLVSAQRLLPQDRHRLARQAGERPPSRGHATSRGTPPARRRATAIARAGATARGAPLVLLAAVNLYVDYRAVLRDVNFALHAGERWAVFGANGAGKSSVLKLLYGDYSPALGGTIERAGCPRGTPIDAWKRRVGYVSPELQSDYAVDVSVFDLVASGRHASIGLVDAASAADRNNTLKWLKFFALSSLAKRRPRELSYGQMRRALIARALACDPQLLLLDEPLTGLDPRQRAAMKRLLERLMGRGLALVIAVHHPEDLPHGMTHALHLQKRRATVHVLQSAT